MPTSKVKRALIAKPLPGYLKTFPQHMGIPAAYINNESFATPDGFTTEDKGLVIGQPETRHWEKKGSNGPARQLVQI
eukprot:CAMPEP_0174350110 /NCGR_PEP_ID=MMETSP0811_2-20130205/7102_1 /TAXON_ID=73025 ORGANISM="Eutreptiella gymnastica-like, Strain CCMP1594" /NCGR_SAMPLE_ID=MMETSP0811_2 /ASSEMBLY_ACC=CAM_ASM_000667 /LENGTH=76 /DNA_ID=CAMNT_0015478127 /DNA_START=449 /DNA_END=679 /DNA_ORIENTATION=+